MGILVFLVLLEPLAAAAQPSFTAKQATAGRAAYAEYCAACHGAKLEGVDIVPALVGERFDQAWRGKPASALLFSIERMPPAPVREGSVVAPEVHANILAYVLLMNGLEASKEPITAEQASGTIPLLAGAERDPYLPVVGAAQRSTRLARLSPVTTETLLDPPPGDWLQWGRTYDGHNFSPLDGINRANVDDLQPAWRAPLRAGTSMPTPLVHGGIMYLHTFPDTVLALDATNGIVLWRHAYEPSGTSSQKMGLALHGDKVIVPTSDLHVLALNAKTGAVVWDHEIAKESDDAGLVAPYQLRSAPFVVRDTVIQGVAASFVPKGGFVVGIDAASGKEIWRFHTIARPGEPGGASWNGVPFEKRSGGSVWHQFTYDPETDLVYFGVAPTYDTGPLLHPVEDPSVTSDALYTNSTVALDPDTGQLAWHYQHLANDQWDMDWVFERQLVTLGNRKVVFNVGKLGILDALDAASGAYLFSVDAGEQNVITGIDPETGRKTIDRAKWPNPAENRIICPVADGARSWPPTSYSPLTKRVYLPLSQQCMTLGPAGFRLLTSGVGITPAPHPGAEDGMMGKIQAVDLENRRLGWHHDLAAPLTTSIVATAGGVVFVGDLEPSLKAFHDTTGELLWQAPLDDGPSSSIVVYDVEGKQYVAVVVGQVNNHVRSMTRYYAMLRASAGIEASEPARGGAAIWVFALEPQR
jgi:alcohol dehydrogenase (cytochrome c)